MGFHKRIINFETTERYLERDNLKLLYSSEALVFMDEYSSSVFELFNEGKSKEEILEKINNKPTKYEIN
jgi:hypothetical protein